MRYLTEGSDVMEEMDAEDVLPADMDLTAFDISGELLECTGCTGACDRCLREEKR